MNEDIEVKSFADVYYDLEKAICYSLRTFERGKGRTLEMLKTMGEKDVAVFHDDNTVKYAFEIAKFHGLNLSANQFIAVAPNRDVVHRYVTGRNFTNKHHFDHYWLELYWRNIIDEGFNVFAARRGDW